MKIINKISIILVLLFAIFNSGSASCEVSTTRNSSSYINRYYWVIYDSVCPYCRSATKYIKELDWEGKFKFISYRDPLTYQMFPYLTMEECEKEVHMVTPEGKVLSGYKVFRSIIDNLTATKIFNPLLKNDFAEKKLNEIYQKMVLERSCYYKKTEACTLEEGQNE